MYNSIFSCKKNGQIKEVQNSIHEHLLIRAQASYMFHRSLTHCTYTLKCHIDELKCVTPRLPSIEPITFLLHLVYCYLCYYYILTFSIWLFWSTIFPITYLYYYQYILNFNICLFQIYIFIITCPYYYYYILNFNILLFLFQ